MNILLRSVCTQHSVKDTGAAPAVICDDIRLAWESFGPVAAPAVLLIMGLGAQMIRWPLEFCECLAGAGFRVIRFDNRDCGRSTHLDGAFVPDIGAMLRSGRMGAVPYTLEDMAADCVGLLDALGIQRAHVVGASMGGAIGQIMAATFPARTLSLTSVMSTSGNPLLPPPTPAAMVSLLAPLPQRRDRDTIVADALARQAVIASPSYPAEPQRLRGLFETEYERGFNPRGVVRQLGAIFANGDRRPLLRTIRVPTAVVHGAADPLVPAECGRDVADSIAAARLHIVPGMGHDLPPALSAFLAEIIVGVAGRPGC